VEGGKVGLQDKKKRCKAHQIEKFGLMKNVPSATHCPNSNPIFVFDQVLIKTRLISIHVVPFHYKKDHTESIILSRPFYPLLPGDEIIEMYANASSGGRFFIYFH